MSSTDPQPIFLVTAGRSGSTLFRLILNDHPEIGCPGETGLPSLIGHLANVWHTVASDVERAHVEVMSAEVKAAVRAAASAPMRFYIEAEGKRIFADKSLETAWHLPAVHDIFPEAKFILLFRHVMDVVASGVAASPWGFQAFGYGPYVARSVDNFVAPLVDHWASQAGEALAWQKEHADICHRVRYEDLVSDPTGTLGGVWEFLDVAPHEPGPGVFERAREARTPGDVKVAFTDHIHQDSLGGGRRVPVEMIPPILRDRANEQLGELGYELITPDWNGEPEKSVTVQPETELSVAVLTALMTKVAPTPDAALARPEQAADGAGGSEGAAGEPGENDTFAVVADDRSGLRWVVGPQGAGVELDAPVPMTLIGSAADLVAAVRGEANPGLLQRERRLRVRDHGEQGKRSEPGIVLARLIDRLRGAATTRPPAPE